MGYVEQLQAERSEEDRMEVHDASDRVGKIVRDQGVEDSMTDWRDRSSVAIEHGFKEGGVVRKGWYQGQRYFIVDKGTSPGWWLCFLFDGDGFGAHREVPEKCLEER